MTAYHVDDAIEFELAPDGFCSRWTYNGRNDRGSTGKWCAARVTEVRSLSYGNIEVVAETDAGDLYHFEIISYAGSYGYPSRGIRLVAARKLEGKVRLVERTDPGSKARYYATEVEQSDAPAARELLTMAETVVRRPPVEDYRWLAAKPDCPVEFGAEDGMSDPTNVCKDCGAYLGLCQGYVYWVDNGAAGERRRDVCERCYDTWLVSRPDVSVIDNRVSRPWTRALASYRAAPARSPFSFSVPAWHYSAWWRRVTRVSHV